MKFTRYTKLRKEVNLQRSRSSQWLLDCFWLQCDYSDTEDVALVRI